MVGDTIKDVAASRAAGVRVLAVTFGYADRPPGELGADGLIGHFDELPARLADLEKNPG
jgi:phosphoglycolate phosphatase